MAKYKKGKCLIEGCKVKRIYSRGLCRTHYRMISILVKKGIRTWDEFINVGMAYYPKRRKQETQQRLLLERMMQERLKNKK